MHFHKSLCSVLQKLSLFLLYPAPIHHKLKLIILVTIEKAWKSKSPQSQISNNDSQRTIIVIAIIKY